MLNRFAFNFFCKFLEFGCRTKYFPYKWDKKAKRLRDGDGTQWFFFSIHRSIIVSMLCFSVFRIIQGMKRGNFPLLLKILNIAWIAVYTLDLIIGYQFDTNSKDIRYFSNCLLDYCDPLRTKAEEEKPKAGVGGTIDFPLSKKERKEGKRIIQKVVFGLILFLANPSVHMILVHETPCSPQFTSSLVFPCVGYSSKEVPFLHKLPFIFIEYYMILTVFTSITICWGLVYLGFCWIRREVNRIKRRLPLVGIPVADYRSIECIASIMNDSFRPYLAAFPSFLFFMVSVMIFGVIRLWHGDLLAFIMFPLCSVECLFDAVTPLDVAGDINFRNKMLLKHWKREISFAKGDTKSEKKYLFACKNSYNGIRCTSGHFFTFDNGIVLFCMHNCIALTLNFLVTFKADR